MKIITSDEQLRMLIPNVLTTVEGEPTLFDKLAPFLESAEDWAKQNFVPEEIFDEIAGTESLGLNERLKFPLLSSCCSAWLLVMTGKSLSRDNTSVQLCSHS